MLKLIFLAIIGLSATCVFIWILVESALDFVGSAYRPSQTLLNALKGNDKPSLTGEEMTLLIELTLIGLKTEAEVVAYLETIELGNQIRKEKILKYLPIEEKKS